MPKLVFPIPLYQRKLTINLDLAIFVAFQSMITQCILFLLAGFETTSTLLAFVAQVLATHPHILDKLQKEIDEHFPEEVSACMCVCMYSNVIYPGKPIKRILIQN